MDVTFEIDDPNNQSREFQYVKPETADGFVIVSEVKYSETAMSWKYAHGTVKIAGFGISLDGGDLSVNLGSTQMANGLKQFTGLT